VRLKTDQQRSYFSASVVFLYENENNSHFFWEFIMCDDKNDCQCEKPENLKTTPDECTPEQIKECHGDEKDHPCVESDKE
jgi:hypothetical protein